MPSIQIKDVPPDVHRTLHTRAAAAGQSLQEYLLAHLITLARRPTLEEILDRAAARGGADLSLAQAAELVRAHREAS